MQSTNTALQTQHSCKARAGRRTTGARSERTEAVNTPSVPSLAAWILWCESHNSCCPKGRGHSFRRGCSWWHLRHSLAKIEKARVNENQGLFAHLPATERTSFMH